MLAGVFDVPSNRVLNVARKMEDFEDFRNVIKLFSPKNMPGNISYKLVPLVNKNAPNKHLVRGLVFELYLERVKLLEMRFFGKKTSLSGPGFTLVNTGLQDCTITEEAETLKTRGFNEKFYLHHALLAFPKVQDPALERIRAGLIRYMSFDNYYNYAFDPGLVGSVEAALYVLDCYHGKTDLSYAGRWRHDTMLLSKMPTGKDLDSIFMGTEAFFSSVYKTSSRQQRVLGVTFRIMVAPQVYFDIVATKERLDLNLQFATFSSSEPAVFSPDKAGALMADLSAEDKVCVYQAACRLLDAIEVVTRSVDRCESVRRALKVFLTVSDQMEMI
jgi:hypothetical protein